MTSMRNIKLEYKEMGRYKNRLLSVIGVEEFIDGFTVSTELTPFIFK